MIDIHAKIPHTGSTPLVRSEAMGINAHHEVVGWYSTGTIDDARAFVWLPEPAYGLSAGAHDLNTLFNLQGDTSIALSINDSGQIAGTYDFSQTIPLDWLLWDENAVTYDGTALIWDLSTLQAVDLSALQDGGPGVASDISNDSPPIAVGWMLYDVPCDDSAGCPTTSPNPTHYAFYVELDSQPALEHMRQLGSTVSFNYARGIAPINTGQTVNVVGDVYDPQATCDGTEFQPVCRALGLSPCQFDYNRAGTRWYNSSETPLEKLPPVQFPRQHWAVGINSSGHIVGRGGIYDDAAPGPPVCTHRLAIFWEHGDGPPLAEPEVLEAAPNAAHEAEASALTNADGQGHIFVVGNNLFSEQALLWRWDDPSEPDDWSAFILEEHIGQGCADIWNLREANDITDDLWIVGWGIRSDDTSVLQRAYLLRPYGECTADLNGDGCVGPDDLDILRDAWDTVGPTCHPADLNGDGKVDGDDLAILIDQWCDPACACPGNPDICPSESLQQSVKEGDFMPLFAYLVAAGEEQLAYDLMDTVGWPE